MTRRWAVLLGCLVAVAACYTVVAVKKGGWPFSARQAVQDEPVQTKPATPVPPPPAIPALEKDKRPAFAQRILEVVEGLPAHAQGVKPGDLLTTLNGSLVRGNDGLDPFRSSGVDRLGIWSKDQGLRELSFEAGPIGITFEEQWIPELSYLRGPDRNAAWDAAMVAAAYYHTRDRLATEAALAHAMQTGCKSPLVAALRLCSASENGEHAAAARERGNLAGLSEDCKRPVLFALYRSLVLDGELEAAEELHRQHPQCNLRPLGWNADAILALRQAAQQAGAEPDDGRVKSVAQDYSAKLECFDPNSAYMQETLRRAGQVSCRLASDKAVYSQFGPLLENPCLGATFRFQPVEAKDKQPVTIELMLGDVWGGRDQYKVTVLCFEDGGVSLWADGYPTLGFHNQTLLNPGDNRVEVFANSPWLQVWLNGRRLFRGYLPPGKRKMFGGIFLKGGNTVIKQVVYADLAAIEPRTPPAVDSRQGPAETFSIPERPQDKRLAWFYDMTVASYLKCGRRNPRWDKDALEAVWLAARWWAHARPRVEGDDILRACKAAAEQGCDDPLVLLLHGDTLLVVGERTTGVIGNAYRRAAEGITDSAYPPLVRFAVLSQAIRYHWASRLKPVQEAALARSKLACSLIPAIVADKDADAEFVRRIFVNATDLPKENLPGFSRLEQFERTYAALLKAAPDGALAATVRGCFYIKYAWEARGSGWASTVSPEGWRLFGERLTVAAESLRKAASSDPGNSIALSHLITVAMAQGLPREDMEDYFEKSVRANPHDLEPYDRKLTYLRPRWLGSAEEVYRFGSECFEKAQRDAAADPSLVKMLVAAHNSLADDAGGGNASHAARESLAKQYWRQPEVWRDILKVYEFLLLRCPRSRRYKTEYASYAVTCGQWGVANRLLKELGDDVATAVFGGPAGAYKTRQLVERMMSSGK
ncbi:MAG: hypothetical protein ABSE73_13720 [Planctomycetota bacterium]